MTCYCKDCGKTLCVCVAVAAQVSERSTFGLDVIKAINYLDGVAAVNLAEPNPGDLERVVQAFAKARADLREAQAELTNCGVEIDRYMRERDEALALVAKYEEASICINATVNHRDALLSELADLRRVNEGLREALQYIAERAEGCICTSETDARDALSYCGRLVEGDSDD